jgi:hypothetical protein
LVAAALVQSAAVVVRILLSQPALAAPEILVAVAAVVITAAVSAVMAEVSQAFQFGDSRVLQALLRRAITVVVVAVC